MWQWINLILAQCQGIGNQARYDNFKRTTKRYSNIYIQLVYLGHLKVRLVNGAFQFSSIDTMNGPSMVVL